MGGPQLIILSIAGYEPTHTVVLHHWFQKSDSFPTHHNMFYMDKNAPFVWFN